MVLEPCWLIAYEQPGSTEPTVLMGVGRLQSAGWARLSHCVTCDVTVINNGDCRRGLLQLTGMPRCRAPMPGMQPSCFVVGSALLCLAPPWAGPGYARKCLQPTTEGCPGLVIQWSVVVCVLGKSVHCMRAVDNYGLSATRWLS